ncbi:MAG TPA: MDR family MFS transporter [Solirubrobacteraceae bacterium]|nr:MDR family MFS transporter [Solirubrobacteraceae bacterium]
MSSLLDRDAGGVQLAFWAIVLAMLPGVLDQTILATALPTIASGLGRLSDVAWVVTAYVVAAAAAAPLWGKLGDRQGRKLMLEASLLLFLAASAVCGAAQSLWMLVVARGIQGAAAGGLMSLAQAAVGDLVSPRERGRYQGYVMATFAVAASVGPLLGGLLVDHASWRWVFYVNLPVGVLALAGLHVRLPAGEAGARESRLDLAGAALLGAGTVALMLACIWGGDRYAWSSPAIVALLAGFALAAALLVLRTRRIPDPIVPLSLIANRSVALASTALFFVTATMFAITVFVPLFLQTTTGASPTQAGLLLIPMMIGITLSTNVAGRLIQRTGRYKVFPIVGLGLICVALLSLAVLVQHPSRVTTGIALTLFGLGFGLVGQVLIAAVQNTVDRRQFGLAMAVTGFFRGLGGAVGAAVLGAVFAARVGATGSGSLALAHAGRVHVISGLHAVFLVAAPLAVIALIAVLAIEEVPLRGPASSAPARKGSAQPATN